MGFFTCVSVQVLSPLLFAQVSGDVPRIYLNRHHINKHYVGEDAVCWRGCCGRLSGRNHKVWNNSAQNLDLLLVHVLKISQICS